MTDDQTDRFTPADSSATDPGLGAKVKFLRTPRVFPERPGTVKALETHMSWVFLTPAFAYKLKKPVRYDFLDFSTPEKRHKDCAEEVRLNRRLAAEVYLGILPLTLDRGRLNLEGTGEAVDWLVRMKRLPRRLMLDAALADHTVQAGDIRRVAEKLTDFYRRARPLAVSAPRFIDGFRQNIHECREQLRESASRHSLSILEPVTGGLTGFLEQRNDIFARRTEKRCIIEVHGDLRPEHVCLSEPPVFIDCLEFNRSFRLLDPVAELAFLSMECELAGGEFASETLIRSYNRLSGDDFPEELVYFYKAERALLRAKLSIWHIRDHDRNERAKWEAKADRYLNHALHYVGRLTG